MGEILLRNMKSSLRSGEIAVAVGGFNFTFCLWQNISPKAKAFDFTVRSTISLPLAPPPLLCYNTLKAVILWKLEQNASLILSQLEH